MSIRQAEITEIEFSPELQSELATELRKIVSEASIASLGDFISPILGYAFSILVTRGVGASAFDELALSVFGFLGALA